MADATGRVRQIAHLARSVSSALELERVLSHVTAAVSALRPDIVCAIRLVDTQLGGYRLAGTGGLRVERRMPLVPFGQGLTHVVAQTRQPLLVPDNQRDPRAVRGHWSAEQRMTVYLGVPIEAGDDLLGVLNVNFPAEAPPSHDEREMIEGLAGQAAVAIRNARIFADADARRRAAEDLAVENQRLYATADRRRREAEALAALGRIVSTSLELPDVARRIVASLLALFGASVTALFRLEAPSGVLVSLAVAGDTGRPAGEPVVFPADAGAVGRAVRERMPVTSPDVLNDARLTVTPELRERIARGGYRAVLAVPLIAHAEVIGALAVGDRAGRHFDDEEVRLAQAFADGVAIALENARLYGEATRRRRAAEELAHLAKVLTESLDIATVAERIVTSMPPFFGAASSGLFLARPDGALEAVAWGGAAQERFAVGEIFPAGLGLIGRALTSGEPSWTTDIVSDPTITLPEGMRARIAASAHRAMLAVPLKTKGRAVGVLSVADTTTRRFSDDEIVLLQAFADQAAIAIDNARLYEQAQRAYHDLEQAQAQLVRGETLRALGQLAAGAAHHLNNLLAVVAGRVQLAELKENVADIRKNLAVAKRALDDSADVVRRLQEFSRAPATASSDRIDLNDLVVEVLELTRPRWQDEPRRQGVEIDASFEAGAVEIVAGEAPALREVLVNLVLNAVDAMPGGGRLAVRTFTRDSFVCCSVEDTGLGMSAEAQRRALEPFFTTKGLQSTGLGLSVSYGIIRRHGGDLRIESREGAGTTVMFTIPVRVPAAPRLAPPPSLPPRRILLVEDTAEVRDTLVDLLVEDGHHVTPAASGDEALRRLDEDGAIDLVVTDLGMPGMNGWAVARAVKSRRPVPVVLLTGWGDEPSDADRAVVDAILRKPMTTAAFRSALARLGTA